MVRNSQLGSALRKPAIVIRRITLVGAPASNASSRVDEVRHITRMAIDRVKETVELLRRQEGISMPRFDADWDEVPTDTPSPSTTLEAFEGERESVRVTIHLECHGDNTTQKQIADYGISHLIGLSIQSNLRQPIWSTNTDGGMLATVKLPPKSLDSILHDILLDMALIRARNQPWSKLYGLLSALELASLKISFLKSINNFDSYLHGNLSSSVYAPISATTGLSSNEELGGVVSKSLRAVVERWNSFASFVGRTKHIEINVTNIDAADRILKEHKNGGQISRQALVKKLETLGNGHYNLYFLERKATNKKKIAQISAFFQCNPSNFHTQRWIVRPRTVDNKLEHLLLTETYISRFPFFLQGF
jgi:hypothetical protein